MGIKCTASTGSSMCEHKLTNLPEVSFASVQFTPSPDCRWQHQPCPPHILIFSSSKLPIYKQPTIRALDNVIKADVSVDKASSMYWFECSQQTIDQTAKLLIALKANASTHWTQSEVDQACATAKSFTYIIHWMLQGLLHIINLHTILAIDMGLVQALAHSGSSQAMLILINLHGSTSCVDDTYRLVDTDTHMQNVYSHASLHIVLCRDA